MGRPSLGQRKQLGIRLPVELVERIDSKRGPVNRNDWIERACRMALGPIGEAINPVHVHQPARLVRTVWSNGIKRATYACSCGREMP
jgi:hypothetical protein